jgi:ketosteroid isomerase-like protein
MTALSSRGDPLATIDRLRSAINDHDLDALVALFAEDHASEHPSHPDRSFVGADQVRRNWTQILGGVPDLHATLVSSAVTGDRAWCEWEWSGTRRDGVPHLMRGVTITTVHDGRIAATRFYMEPVVRDGVDVEAVVEHAMGARAPEPAR